MEKIRRPSVTARLALVEAMWEGVARDLAPVSISDALLAEARAQAIDQDADRPDQIPERRRQR